MINSHQTANLLPFVKSFTGYFLNQENIQKSLAFPEGQPRCSFDNKGRSEYEARDYYIKGKYQGNIVL